MMDPYQTPQLSKPRRAVVIVLMLVGLLMVFLIIMAIALSGDSSIDSARKLTGQQTEIMRIAQVGNSHNSASQSVKNFSSTVASVASTAINSLGAVNGGTALSREESSQYQDSAVDSQLENAGLANEFGAVFMSVMRQKIEEMLLTGDALLENLADDKKPVVQAIIDDYRLLLEETN